MQDPTVSVNTGTKVSDPVVEPKVDVLEEPAITVSDKKTVPLADLMSERKKRQALEVELDAKKAAEAKVKEDKLKEEGKYQELLAEKDKELQALKPKADAFDELDASERAEIKEALDDKWDDDYNDLPLKVLRKIKKNLSLPGKIDADNGGGFKGGKDLTDAEKAEAKRMDLSEDGYKRFKQKREEAKNKKENKLWPV